MVIYLYTFIDSNDRKDGYATFDGVHAVERAKSLGLGLIENKFTMDDSELVEDYRDHGEDEEESDEEESDEEERDEGESDEGESDAEES